MNEKDLELARRAASGDQEAFEHIYLTYKGQILGHIRGKVGTRFEAEDLAQEVFVRAYQALGTYSGKASLGRWLRVIATNLCIDRMRKKAVSCVAWPTVISKEGDKMPVDVPDESPSLQDRVESSDGTRIVLEAVSSLPPYYRDAVILHDLLDQSGESVARRLDCPQGTVKSRLSRARGLLRHQLAAATV